jgi:tRNA A-37 threonylcarbamoyl transferase component Bud32
MKMDEVSEVEQHKAHHEFFRDVLLDIHNIMETEYHLSEVCIKPVGAEVARLSIPIKIEGVDKDGNKVRYFGKILGGSDNMTARAIQLVKNLYLHMNSMAPMFRVTESPEELARHQYEMMNAINQLGIPTATPRGVYPLRAKLWLLVADYLDAKPITDIGELTEDHLDTVFGYLRKMHDNAVFHGDIKPDNLMFGDKVYIVDVGNFMNDAPPSQKLAYDLASQITSFLEYKKTDTIVDIARKYYSCEEMMAAAKYLDMIQRRPDILLSNENKEELTRIMNLKIRRRLFKRSGKN